MDNSKDQSEEYLSAKELSVPHQLEPDPFNFDEDQEDYLT